MYEYEYENDDNQKADEDHLHVSDMIRTLKVYWVIWLIFC